ncbi:MAG TPA: sugar ABC transporter ATP-binding protein, partial [Vicinamibacteria bacterium]|nr:sugar ABC transporter ATP-binding protein [Vicinamibacteria bacterium]
MLVGPNGGGKTTLLRLLHGQLPHAGQRVLAANREPRQAMVFQRPFMLRLTVLNNLRVALWLAGVPGPDRDARARAALERVGLSVDPRRPVRELGVGQQQMVEIAKALAKDASVLVLDEPTAALTEADAARLLDLVAQLRQRGIGSIYISHRLEEVFRIADRITVLRDGRSVASRKAEALPQAEVIALMVGREVRQMYPRPPRPQAGAPCALRVSDWWVADPLNPGRRVVSGVSFEVRAGEVLGIAGLMGAGRTALLSSLFGAALAGAQGRLAVAEAAERGPFASPAAAIRAGIALVSEDRKRFGLVPEGSVRDNLTLVTLRRFVRRGLLDHDTRDGQARTQADALRIRAASLDTPVRLLSGGNQQKVVLGKWLLASPRVLLLDEPTRGIDVGAKAEVYQLVAELAGRGLGVVLVSSELPEVLGMSHRVHVMRGGRLVAKFDRAEASAETIGAAMMRD